jgi:hypothetical protein
MTSIKDLQEKLNTVLARHIDADTGEANGISDFWVQNAHDSANARDVVDALNDAELLLAALDDEETRLRVLADFSSSFWLQKYLVFAHGAGASGRAVAVAIVAEQAERWRVAVDEMG